MTKTTQHSNNSAECVSSRKNEITIPLAGEIRAIVFDLDGTLYVSDEFAAAIQDGAAVYLSGVLEVSVEEARQTMAATRRRLTKERGVVQTLSTVCVSLGGSIPDVHAFFQKHLTPESFLIRDDRVVALLKRLRQQFALYVYTNNNRALTARSTRVLGIDGCFNGIFSIDDTWRAKPDEERLEQILKTIGLPACEVLFVGDRYEVDLRLPEQKGCPVFLSTNIDQLLRLDQLVSSEGT
jgi:HAD superfamily hydrolase (TIGR01549 family)